MRDEAPHARTSADIPFALTAAQTSPTTSPPTPTSAERANQMMNARVGDQDQADIVRTYEGESECLGSKVD